MSEMRRCPWCAEWIQSMARICRYCQREVAAVSDPGSAYLADPPDGQSPPDVGPSQPAPTRARTEPPEAQDSDRQFVYRSQHTLVKWMSGCFVAYLLIALVAVWSGSLELTLLNDIADGRIVTQAQADANDARQGLVGLLQLVVYLTLIVLFLVWINRANKNARALGAEGMTFTPAACVWWWFAPIFWLWKPYQAVKEIWRASATDRDADWRNTRVPALLGWWWFFWIVGNIFAWGGFRASTSEDIDLVIAGGSLIFMSDLLDIPLTVLVILVVTRISDGQRRQSMVGL
jgi:hypothetical protein